MSQTKANLIDIKTAYWDGGIAARLGESFDNVPHAKRDIQEAWKRGWTDAMVHVGAVGSYRLEYSVRATD